MREDARLYIPADGVVYCSGGGEVVAGKWIRGSHS